MPERMTSEERKISMAIEKARDAKQILYQSLMDNNRSELEDESEAVKITRPKAENVNLEMKPQGTHSGFGLGSHATAGDSLKKSQIISKRQTPTSFEQVVEMANKELQSGRVGVNKEILSNIASLARQEIKSGSQFSEQKLKEIIEDASRYNAIKDYMGLN